MLTIRDKINGMILGACIGDALGMPVESFKPDRIIEEYPQTEGYVDSYLRPDGHKWFDGQEAVTWTDDTALTLAVMRGIIDADGGLGMSYHANRHIEALDLLSGSGFGRTTRESIQSLKDGSKTYRNSGKSKDGLGLGNGVCMKVSPLAAYLRLVKEKHDANKARGLIANIFKFSNELSAMTHNTSMAMQSSIAHIVALDFCLSASPDNLSNEKSLNDFKETIARLGIYACWFAKTSSKVKDEGKDRLEERYVQLTNMLKDGYTDDEIIESFGGGSCYVFNSLPFSHAFFLTNPLAIDTLYRTVSAGGDADSNGSMVGSMLGAVHGTDIFPEDLIEGLSKKDEILDISNEFIDTLESAFE